MAVWYDDETEEVIFQYGYASISMPVEDYEDFTVTVSHALDQLEKL